MESQSNFFSFSLLLNLFITFQSLEPEAEELRIQLESLIQKSNLKGDGMIKPTPFTSADMVMMIVLTRKVK